MAETVVISTKIGADLAEKVENLAASRLLSVSALMRTALERELAQDAGGDMGPVEAAARLEIVGTGPESSQTKVQAALNLARRLDLDPTNGATHARELRALLDDLAGSTHRTFDIVDELRARHILRMAGYRLIAPDGHEIGS